MAAQVEAAVMEVELNLGVGRGEVVAAEAEARNKTHCQGCYC